MYRFPRTGLVTLCPIDKSSTVIEFERVRDLQINGNWSRLCPSPPVGPGDQLLSRFGIEALLTISEKMAKVAAEYKIDLPALEPPPCPCSCLQCQNGVSLPPSLQPAAAHAPLTVRQNKKQSQSLAQSQPLNPRGEGPGNAMVLPKEKDKGKTKRAEHAYKRPNATPAQLNEAPVKKQRRDAVSSDNGCKVITID